MTLVCSVQPLAGLSGQNCSALTQVPSVLGPQIVLSWGPSWPVVLAGTRVSELICSD